MMKHERHLSNIENVRKYWMDKSIQLFLGLQDFQVGILGLSPALCKKRQRRSMEWKVRWL